MKKNMGNTDRMIRAIIAIIIAALYFTGTLSGTIGTVLLVLAMVFLLTSLISVCPIYALFNIRTTHAEKSNAAKNT